MSNKITVVFKPCSPAPALGYNIYYKPLGSTIAYRFAGNFQSSPAIFFDNVAPGGSSYEPFEDGTKFEGFIQSICSADNRGDYIFFSDAAAPPAINKVMEWAYFDEEPENFHELVYNHSTPFTPGTDVSMNVVDMQPNQWMVARHPATEQSFTKWFNTELNQGQIPDQVWEAPVVIGAWKYYKSNVAFSLDSLFRLVFKL